MAAGADGAPVRLFLQRHDRLQHFGELDIGYGTEGVAIFTGISYPF